jgi:hypothetical protein
VIFARRFNVGQFFHNDLVLRSACVFTRAFLYIALNIVDIPFSTAGVFTLALLYKKTRVNSRVMFLKFISLFVVAIMLPAFYLLYAFTYALLILARLIKALVSFS